MFFFAFVACSYHIIDYMILLIFKGCEIEKFLMGVISQDHFIFWAVCLLIQGLLIGVLTV